ncbi:Asp23/Gls24 family envelope stress response protein [Bogoriella caseilytica]|uniref:Asp23/Gls24 family envelope stress response protein n=1 Tax=Bogoriella caseilytica TaxID=56055 RepID=UPI0011CE1181|nr:Asp23/Gls24 family envelope stress response protein [Bogoriella caseilytica]
MSGPRPAPVVTDDLRLECGRDMDELWDGLGEPASSHERTCPACRRARAAMAPLAKATSQLRAQEHEEPAWEPGPQVLSRVMAVARAEVRRSKRLPLDEPEGAVAPPERAPLTVSEQTVAAVARRAADSLAEVQVRRSRVELARASSAATGSATAAVAAAGGGPTPPRPARVAVSLQISVALRAAIPDIARQVRERVRQAITAEVGVETVVVDINVQGVHDA